MDFFLYLNNMKDYNADSISYLEGLEQIRRRTDMYMGGTTGIYAPALYRMLREIIDNSLDERLGGYAKKLYVICDTQKDEYTVIDDGRGIPTDINKKSGKSALTLVFTQIHAGGKFDKDSYKVSSGKNGVGNKGTNAISEYLIVWSNNNKGKKWMNQKFKRGKPITKVQEEKLPKELKQYVGKTGTIVTFKPDKEIFKDSIKMDLKRLRKELNDIQYLCPKLEIHLIIDGEDTTYYSEKGIVELTASEKSTNDPFDYSDETMDVAINFTQEENYTFKSFVNICHTDMGGTHLNGLKKAICNVVKENSKQKISNDDILEGVIGAIHYRMAEPQYQGQTKNELTSSEPEKIVIETITPQLEKYFRKNKDLLNRIVSYAEKMLEQRNKMKASKDLLKGLKTLNSGSRYISDKFLDADRRKHKVKDLEMFIVEGDSAGGHFKHARESYQAELKIRGKIINSEKASAEELFGKPTKKGETKCDGNREIKDIVAALGCGIQEDYDESKLRFGKVIILTDKDSDGGHISCLLSSFFVNYMPDLIKNGHLYVVDAPLFMATSARNRVFGMTRAEVDEKMKKLKCSDYTVLRMKGWGECNPEQLAELCLDPKTRKLKQVQWTDDTIKTCSDIMGENTAYRKELMGISKG